MILYRLEQSFIYGAKLIFIGISIIFLRMCIPLNFPFTYTIYSSKLLLPLAKMVYASLGTSGYRVFDILLLCWLIVAIIKSGRLYVRTVRLRNYLDAYTITNDNKYLKFFEAAKKHCTKPFKIAIVPENISPAVSGILHPTIIFPESCDCFSAEELDYICMHEINHYKNHDLWVKMLLEIIACIHWWNPLVYIMKREYALTLELTNDYLLIQNHQKKYRTNYAELIIKIAESVSTALPENPIGFVPFVRKRNSDLKVRLSFILNDSGRETKKKIHLLIHTLCICTVMFFSLMIVVEPNFRTSPVTKDQTFEMEPENTYFVYTSNGYEIYVNRQYLGTIKEIPEIFKDYKIYKQEDMIK